MTLFEIWLLVIFVILVAGSILSAYFKTSKFLIILSLIFSFVTAIYFVRGIIFPDGVFPDAFVAERCLKKAKKDNLTYRLHTKNGIKEVKDFRQHASRVQHTGYPVLELGMNNTFKIFFNPSGSNFNILLVLIDGSVTPLSAANDAALFLQNQLCLTKKQICMLSYEINAPKATNVNHPELSGRSYHFNFCDQ